jgi:Uma2 family endonuclease
MKAVILEVSARELERRRRMGLDSRDEMWEGVLHMAPAPSDEHQRILDELIVFLVPLVKRQRKGTMRSGINVFDEKAASEDYRIPDLTFVAAGRESLLAADGVRGGGPDAVLEIRSPADETYEKLPFFARLGVREVLVVDRDTKKPEVFRLAGSHYLAVAQDREGCVTSECLGVRLRQVAGPPARLILEDLSDPHARIEI